MKWCKKEDIEVSLKIPELNLKGSIDAVISIARYHEICESLGIPKEQRGNLTGTHVILDIKTKKDAQRQNQHTYQYSHTFPDDIINYPSLQYYVQLQCYMYLISKLYPERYPDVQFGILLFVCKNDGRMYAICIRKDISIGKGIEEKAARMMQALKDHIAPTREYGKSEPKCCGWQIEGEYQYGCPYYELCWRGT